MFSLEDLYEEIKERAFAEGAFSRDEWNGLVEEILNTKREFEEMHEDFDWTEIQEALIARYDDFQVETPEM